MFQADVVNRHVIPLVRRAIEASHDGMTVLPGNAWPGRIAGGEPDVAFFLQKDKEMGRPDKIRFPLEVKLSANWNSQWRHSEKAYQRTEYYQVLSQINYYMDIFNTKYGGILTDRELVVVQRSATFGHLSLRFHPLH
jgi:hypothetical protein